MDERPILTPFVATEANKDFEDFRRTLVSKVRKSVESGNEADVKKWLSAHSVDEDLGGSTLLHMACASGRASIARMLLKKGTFIDSRKEACAWAEQNRGTRRWGHARPRRRARGASSVMVGRGYMGWVEDAQGVEDA